MTVLYDYWRSSAAYRMRIALGLLNLPHETVSVNLLKGEQSSPENLARNPQGLVPTLEIDGLVLTQSLAMLEYLDETRGPCFLPTDPAGRARVRALAYAIAMEVAPVCNLRVRKFGEQISDGRVTADDWQRHFIPPGLAALEQMLDHRSTGLCCHGDSVTLADICLMPQLYNAQRAGIDVTYFPRIAQIMAHLAMIPAFDAALPDHHKPKG